MSNIFISYRRKDASTIVGWLIDRLAATFGDSSIFRDIDSIELGQDFRESIATALQECDVLLAIVGKEWLAAETEDGKRRLDDENDYVRVEIATALVSEVLVIPVLVRGASMPAVDKLPNDLRPLAYLNAAKVRDDPDFDADVERLLKRLRKQFTPRGWRRFTGRAWLLSASCMAAILLFTAHQIGVFDALLRDGADGPPKSSVEEIPTIQTSTTGPTLTAEQVSMLLKMLEERPEYVRPKSAEEPSTPATLNPFWPTGSTISIAFIGGDKELHDFVENSANEWLDVANLTFQFGVDARDSEVRISFVDHDGNWSYRGIECLPIPKTQATMNIGGVKWKVGEMERKGYVLQAFGYMLGLIREFQSPNADIAFNWDKVYSDLTGPPNNWTRRTVDLNLRPFTNAPPQYKAKPFDQDSIMMYNMNADWLNTESGLAWKMTLSDRDKEFVSTLYPGR